MVCHLLRSPHARQPPSTLVTLASIRHERRIAAPAEVVWALAGDPTRLAEWFPGIVGCVVEGRSRTITLASGLSMPEELLVIDDVNRRFVYAITAPLFTSHRGTIDVVDLGDGTCLALYGTEADPRTMALVIAGAAAEGLDRLAELTEPEGA